MSLWVVEFMSFLVYAFFSLCFFGAYDFSLCVSLCVYVLARIWVCGFVRTWFYGFTKMWVCAGMGLFGCLFAC